MYDSTSRSYCLSSTSPPECSAAPVSARPSNAPSPSGRVAATVLVLGLLLLWSTPAEAQTARILVSNVSQGGDDEVNLSGNDHAQLFHTGASNTGWVLTSLTVVAENAEDFDVEICEADDTTELPTSTCTELTRPGSFAAGSLEFTYDGFLILSANDNYLAVFKQDGSENVTLDSTTNSGEDATGLSDWSIKNKFDWNNGGTWQHKGGSNEAIQITVNGYQRPANQDATGRPSIYPSAEGAGILLADTEGIADGNGVLVVGSRTGEAARLDDWSYQWIRVDSATAAETNIGADSLRYQPVDADIGNLIKVSVSFEDGRGYSETVTSLPFGPLAQPAGPSQTPSTLVSNTGQSASATAMITQQYGHGLQVGDSRPGLRNLERLDRTGRGAVEPDRLPVDRRPYCQHAQRGRGIQAVRLYQPPLLPGRPEQVHGARRGIRVPECRALHRAVAFRRLAVAQGDDVRR